MVRLATFMIIEIRSDLVLKKIRALQKHIERL